MATTRTKLSCKYNNAISGVETTRLVEWRLFYPQCGKLNLQCNPQAGAYVSAITVCELHLWSWADELEDQ